MLFSLRAGVSHGRTAETRSVETQQSAGGADPEISCRRLCKRLNNRSGTRPALAMPLGLAGERISLPAARHCGPVKGQSAAARRGKDAIHGRP